MSSWAPAKYKTTNCSTYNEALRQRGSLTFWFDPDMMWKPALSWKRGRQPIFSDKAIRMCLTMKGEGRLGNAPVARFSPERVSPGLFGMPLRQTAGFVQSLLRRVGLDWRVPDFSTLCRRQKTLNVSIHHRSGTGPLNLLIDSTGIKAEGEGE